jgi:hypothetical protein
MKKRADAYFGPLYIPELPGGFFLGAGRAEWGAKPDDHWRSRNSQLCYKHFSYSPLLISA